MTDKLSISVEDYHRALTLLGLDRPQDVTQVTATGQRVTATRLRRDAAGEKVHDGYNELTESTSVAIRFCTCPNVDTSTYDQPRATTKGYNPWCTVHGKTMGGPE